MMKALEESGLSVGKGSQRTTLNLSMWAGITLTSTSLLEKELKRRESGTEHTVSLEDVKA